MTQASDIHPFDFQIQTTASDGVHSPAACVAMAKENGVETIAITDHDTVAGVAEAITAGAELRVRVIPGIEISIQEHGMHLLGLGIETTNQPLAEALAQAAANRLAAAREMVENFNKGGFAIDWEDVLAKAGASAVVTRPHIAAAIMARSENREKLEGIATKYEFFQRYFTDQSPYYVRASTINPEQAISLVHGAGGIAVWSHPPIPDFVGKCADLEQFLIQLISHGLDGLELFGAFLTEGDLICLESLVSRHHLLATAGSDFHERREFTNASWPRSAVMIGEFPTWGRDPSGIPQAIEAAIARRRMIVQEA